MARPTDGPRDGRHGAGRDQLTAFASTAAGLALVSADPLWPGRILQVNDAFASLVGLSASALQGRAVTEFLTAAPSSDRRRLDAIFAGRALRAAGTCSALSARGRTVECSFTAATARQGENRTPVAVLSLSVTAAQQKEEANRSRASAEAVATAPFGIAHFDASGRCTRANPAWTALGGAVAGDEGVPRLMAGGDDTDSARQAVFAAVAGSRQELTLIGRHSRADRFRTRVVLVPRIDADGDNSGFYAFGREIAGDHGAPDDDPAPVPDTGNLIGIGAASRTLGVSTSTVRRWIDDGRLRATRTAGGHRRVARRDVRRMVHAASRPSRVRNVDLPAGPLPILARILTDSGSTLTRNAARLTYEVGAEGWFAGPEAVPVLDAWAARTARALHRSGGAAAVSATTALFQTARDFASLEECLVFADRLSMLIIQRLQHDLPGQSELDAGRKILAAMRRALVILEDARA